MTSKQKSVKTKTDNSISAKKAVPSKSKDRITKDMLIADVVGQYPATIEPLLKSGLHCIGCGAAKWESLEQGLMAHGKSAQEITELVKILNGALPILLGDEKKIQITQVAIDKALATITELNSKAIRISIVEGCCGSTFNLGLEANEPGADDDIYTIKGLQIVYKKSDAKELAGTTIDYVKTMQGEGFVVSNPAHKKEHSHNEYGGGCC